MYKEACNLPWLHCLDHISEANRDNEGVVPFYAAKIEELWKNSAGSQIVRLEDGVVSYKNTR
jgi:hypothetical protein